MQNCIKIYFKEQYQEGLSSRPHAILGNKIDLKEAIDNIESFEEHLSSHTNVPIFYVSGKVGTNLRSVLEFMKRMKDERNQ